MRMAPALVVALVLGLGGCSLTGESARPHSDENPFYTVGEVGGAGKRLIPFTTLSGYLVASNSGGQRALKALAGLPERSTETKRPSIVAASEHGVYVIDSVSQALYRFRWQIDGEAHADPEHIASAHNGLSHAEWTRLRLLNDMVEPNDLFIAPNGDLYISDGQGHKVVRFDKDGNPQQEFVDAENLRQPVAVTVDARGLRVFVADGLYDRVVAFSPQGASLYGIGFRGDGPGGFRNIRSMVQGKSGLLYVVNGLKQQIQSYGLDGTFMGSFGQGTFSDPDGITVDEENRIYLADRFNHRLLIFHEGKLVESYGKFGVRAGEFNQPGRIAYYKGRLYVADRENGRIQVFRVVPERMIKGGGK